MSGLRSKLLTSFLLATGSLAANPALAVSLGFTLSINDPVFNSANGNLNVPDFQLENTSQSGIAITDFNLTIGDPSFNFDFVRIQTAFVDQNADLTYTLNTVGLSNNGVGDDVLDYDFTGFDVGDIFRFEVDVDPDSGSPSQDFRAVLFPNAVANVTFSDGTVLTQTFSTLSPTGSSFAFDVAEIVPVPLPGGFGLYLMAGLVGGSLAHSKRPKRR